MTRKDLMHTTFDDGVGYVPFRDRPVCDRCTTFFMPGQDWYLPAELSNPICGSCLEALHYEQYEWIRAMDEYAFLQEHGQLDPDTREPSEPMYDIAF